MKTRILLTMIGAAALTAITFNANAGLLSPRAAGNQMTSFAGTYSDSDLVTVGQSQATAPRAQGSQIAITAGTNDSVNPTLACRNMAGTPKTIQACAEHPAAMPGCNVTTVAALK